MSPITRGPSPVGFSGLSRPRSQSLRIVVPLSRGPRHGITRPAERPHGRPPPGTSRTRPAAPARPVGAQTATHGSAEVSVASRDRAFRRDRAPRLARSGVNGARTFRRRDASGPSIPPDAVTSIGLAACRLVCAGSVPSGDLPSSTRLPGCVASGTISSLGTRCVVEAAVRFWLQPGLSKLMAMPDTQAPAATRLVVRGARTHNLKKVDVPCRTAS